MSEIWEQKRNLLLRLGTQEYQKPIQLPSSVPVLDFAKNKLTNAENYVEPIRSDNTFVYSDTELYVLGLPFPKKGFHYQLRNELAVDCQSPLKCS